MKDLEKSCLSKFMMDPDQGNSASKILKKLNATTETVVPLPLVKHWTTNLAELPKTFCYNSIVEYVPDST